MSYPDHTIDIIIFVIVINDLIQIVYVETCELGLSYLMSLYKTGSQNI